ncbi:MAG: sigma-70 family RNA polymerase sigma factor [Streptosporangiaceae bacterium]|nr:sigma-70 family RNA polymerase sigma factor [Streptosporangiaceae bacterium]
MVEGEQVTELVRTRMRDDPSVVALVARAADGDQHAWDEIVERYAPLVWSVCMRYRLTSHDAEDVGQTVWLLLVEQLGRLREPAALPGWLATTTHRECLRVVAVARRSQSMGSKLEDTLPFADPSAIDQEIITAERNAALRAALAELPEHCRELLSMLVSDPPRSYAEISAALRIPVGSIGPQRARCLERLRKSTTVIALGEDEIPTSAPGGGPRV